MAPFIDRGLIRPGHPWWRDGWTIHIGGLRGRKPPAQAQAPARPQEHSPEEEPTSKEGVKEIDQPEKR